MHNRVTICPLPARSCTLAPSTLTRPSCPHPRLPRHYPATTPTVHTPTPTQPTNIRTTPLRFPTQPPTHLVLERVEALEDEGALRALQQSHLAEHALLGLRGVRG